MIEVYILGLLFVALRWSFDRSANQTDAPLLGFVVWVLWPIAFPVLFMAMCFDAAKRR